MTVHQLGASIVHRYGQFYGSYSDETLSAIDLATLRQDSPNSLSSALNQFATTLVTTATSHDRLYVDWYRDRHAYEFSSEDYCDIGNLFSDMVSDVTLSYEVRNLALSVLNAYSDTVIYNYSSTPGRSTGLSIYFSDKGSYPAATYSSDTLQFAADTSWDNFLNWPW